MNKTGLKNKRPLIITLSCAFVAVCVLALYVLFAHRFYIVYGIYDTLRPAKRGVLVSVDFSEDVLTPFSSDEPGIVKKTYCLYTVNETHPIGADYEVALTDAGGDFLLQNTAREKIDVLFSACESICGEEISYTSTYRTYEEQEAIFADNPFAVRAGTSEHECGLAADIRTPDYASLRFIMSDTGKWLAENAGEYGFIIRYPYWGEGATGVSYEPWHLRYVAYPHSQIMYETKTVLDDYASLYKTGEFYSFDGYIISYQRPSDGILYYPSELTDVYFSPDNAGGYFVFGS